MGRIAREEQAHRAGEGFQPPTLRYATQERTGDFVRYQTGGTNIFQTVSHFDKRRSTHKRDKTASGSKQGHKGYLVKVVPQEEFLEVAGGSRRGPDSLPQLVLTAPQVVGAHP